MPRKPYLFATASRLPLLGLGDRPPVEEVLPSEGDVFFAQDQAGPPPRTPTREDIDELVRVSNQQTVLRHLHPRALRAAYED